LRACVVGRGSEADVQLDDESASRRHALFRVLSAGPIVEDLDSRNGTFVNGIPVVGRAHLSQGDRIALGSCLVEVIPLSAQGSDEPVTRPMSRDFRGGLAGSLTALSPREQHVFPMLASGMSAREIALQLGVGVKTIETYRMRIRHKLGLTTRAQIVRFALEAGVLRSAD
jgi:pSer/pThr/pTyr-binding forkhead associated (FHA) protein